VPRKGLVVVKVGGSTWNCRDAALDDLVALQKAGTRVIVVHGGGSLVSKWLEIHQVETRFVDGLRRTDEAALPVVVAVLAGLVNKELVAGINSLGGHAVGVSGADAHLLMARRLPELGLVGEIEAIHPCLLASLLDEGYMPIVAPIALESEAGPEPQLLNVNADSVAGEIAAALTADYLIFLTDVPGILDGESRLIPCLTCEEAQALVKKGTVAGGMLPKVAACIKASTTGTSSLIVDGRLPEALRSAIAGKIAGTKVG
jgi:acetylglutamate kinase